MPSDLINNKSKSNDSLYAKHAIHESTNLFDQTENLEEEIKNSLFGHSIDQKLDAMIKDWYTNHDVLFSIHPIDGSILIWLVDWLDEYLLGNYRQVQVSFHAKLPNTVPVGDAMSLTDSVFLYTEPIRLINSSIKNENEENEDELESGDKVGSMYTNYKYISGVVNMVSKHSNGTLNLWRLQLQENSKYQSLINVSHVSRICGHRFRVNEITSHPVLPFLLTNSINDIKTSDDDTEKMSTNQASENETSKSSKANEGLLETFQKGIIIWGVEPVGPLSKSGGIYELARIDSSKQNAFENIAWFPCFLPSSTLGTSSSSPSTLFVSTHSNEITIYQAVFDARTLLHDIQLKDLSSNKPTKLINSLSTLSNTTDIPFNSFNVVSIQSTARPGCIIELEQLADSFGNWTKADLFHIYQEGLILNNRNEKAREKLNFFHETYYLVLLEKSKNKNKRNAETVHMWKIIVQSHNSLVDEHQQQQTDKLAQDTLFFSTSQESPSRNSPNMKFSESLNGFNFDSTKKNRLTISSLRVCHQDLHLPEGVSVVCADSAAADLSSSAMFTQNKVPYLFSTACSDGVIRFWSCKQKDTENENENDQFDFVEWQSNSAIDEPKIPSQVNIENFPLAISCSYNSRFAIAFKKKSESIANKETNKFVNFCVYIYECESSGGEWKIEDCINLKDIVLPEIDSGIDFEYIYGNHKPIRPARSCHSFKNIVMNSSANSNTSSNLIQNTSASIVSSSDNFKIPEIPSNAAKVSIKRQYSINKHLKNDSNDFSSELSKRFIKLDWASTENGSHILTIGLGNQIFVYSCVKRDVAQEKLSKSVSTQSSFEQDEKKTSKIESMIKWVQLRTFELDSADDMQALPTQIRWVRDGLLIVGLNTEMQVYSQWSPLTTHQNDSITQLKSTVDIKLSLAAPAHSVIDLNKLNRLTKKPKLSTIVQNKTKENERKEDKVNTRVFDETQMHEIIQDSGLFMQAK